MQSHHGNQNNRNEGHYYSSNQYFNNHGKGIGTEEYNVNLTSKQYSQTHKTIQKENFPQYFQLASQKQGQMIKDQSRNDHKFDTRRLNPNGNKEMYDQREIPIQSIHQNPAWHIIFFPFVFLFSSNWQWKFLLIF